VIELHAAHGLPAAPIPVALSNHGETVTAAHLKPHASGYWRWLPALAARCGANALFVRVSATDWVDGGWDLDQCVELARGLRPLGLT